MSPVTTRYPHINGRSRTGVNSLDKSKRAVFSVYGIVGVRVLRQAVRLIMYVTV